MGLENSKITLILILLYIGVACQLSRQKSENCTFVFTANQSNIYSVHLYRWHIFLKILSIGIMLKL